MMNARMRLLLPVWFAICAPVVGAEKRALTVEDIMKFRQIEQTVLSADGRWVAFQARPDRGDPEVQVRSTRGSTTHTMARGADPAISRDGLWVAASVLPPFRGEEEKDDEAQPGMALLNTRSGEVIEIEGVARYAFSRDSRWLAYRLLPEAGEGAAEKGAAEEPSAGDDRLEPGTSLILRDLRDARESRIEFVTGFEFNREGDYLAYTATTPDGEDNGVFCRHLSVSVGAEVVLARMPDARYGGLEWSRRDALAFLQTADGEPAATSLHLWIAPDSSSTLLDASSVPAGWRLPEKSELSWSGDGRRLFLGLRPDEQAGGPEEGDRESELFDPEALLAKREVDVWHWSDPRIIPNQKQVWERVRDWQYDAVYHLDENRLQLLADAEVPEVRRPSGGEAALGLAEGPWLRESTWEGGFEDAWWIDLDTGRRERIARRVSGEVVLSPGGRYAAWFQDEHWHLYDAEEGRTRTLTTDTGVPFFNEDHDYPSERPSYGSAGWLEGDDGLLLYDKYDIWKFPLPSGQPVCLTGGAGRRERRIFRAVQTDPEADAWDAEGDLLLHSSRELLKNDGFYRLDPVSRRLTRLLEEPKKFNFVARAEDADVLLYTRQDYGEFPDLWVSDPTFEEAVRVTKVNPQIDEFAFGAAELVEWKSLDGIPLQGVLIRPDGAEAGKRYPVIVYFYRFFSQRLHEFNEMVINHRPNFAYYVSNGYAVFLPDIRFEVGRPGFSATKCLVPGVQKLIDMGVADPEAIGLHGHSWSGYQTAFVITQTNLFAAAVAGAPVSNMTSAYSGIRWQSGLARQFQYERTQSRIGGSLWEYPERYIENSPVFFADRIQTPLLIQFGDEDGAVPWYQGIELYLAMRRLEKPTVMLQYRGEPHHLQKYANKLDYTLKMKEFFDHFLKGAPAPDWWSSGVPYNGR